MEVWKIIFLYKWVICRFHVNLPGCILRHVWVYQFFLSVETHGTLIRQTKPQVLSNGSELHVSWRAWSWLPWSWKVAKAGSWKVGIFAPWFVFYMNTSGQILATSHVFSPPNGGLVREMPWFHGNLGWWNIIIWPDNSLKNTHILVMVSSIVYFHPDPWGRSHFDKDFWNGLKPPTRYLLKTDGWKIKNLLFSYGPFSGDMSRCEFSREFSVGGCQDPGSRRVYDKFMFNQGNPFLIFTISTVIVFKQDPIL